MTPLCRGAPACAPNQLRVAFICADTSVCPYGKGVNHFYNASPSARGAIYNNKAVGFHCLISSSCSKLLLTPKVNSIDNARLAPPVRRDFSALRPTIGCSHCRWGYLFHKLPVAPIDSTRFPRTAWHKLCLCFTRLSLLVLSMGLLVPQVTPLIKFHFIEPWLRSLRE